MGTRRFAVVLLVAWITATCVYAEIAPDEYRNMQLSAPESLTITVLRVRRSSSLFGRTVNVNAQVEVTSIERSASRLSAGDTITIVYEHYKNPKRGWVGPRAIPILVRGEESYAFLAFDNELNAYVPAARGASFEMPIPLR